MQRYHRELWSSSSFLERDVKRNVLIKHCSLLHGDDSLYERTGLRNQADVKGASKHVLGRARPLTISCSSNACISSSIRGTWINRGCCNCGCTTPNHMLATRMAYSVSKKYHHPHCRWWGAPPVDYHSPYGKIGVARIMCKKNKETTKSLRHLA